MPTPATASLAYANEIRVIASTSAIVYTPAGGGTSRTVSGKLDEIHSPLDYGALGSPTDDSVAFNACQAQMGTSGVFYLPGPRDYVYGAHTPVGPFLWFNKGWTDSLTPAEHAVTQAILVSVQTAATTPYDPLEERDGIRILAKSLGQQIANGIRITTLNESSASTDPTCGLHVLTETKTTSLVNSGVHVSVKGASALELGMSVDLATYRNTAGTYAFGLQITNNSAGVSTSPLAYSGLTPQDHPNSRALVVQGGANSTANQKGGWKIGIDFLANSMKDATGPNGAGTAIRFLCAGCDYLIHSTGVASCNIADIVLSGTSPYGIVLSGTYSSSALRINDNNAMSWNSSATIRTLYDQSATYAANSFVFLNTLTNRIAFNLTTTPSISLNGTKVIGTRKTGWGLATGTPTRTTFATGSVTLSQLAERVKALIDDLHATAGHGLIGT